GVSAGQERGGEGLHRGGADLRQRDRRGVRPPLLPAVQRPHQGLHDPLLHLGIRPAWNPRRARSRRAASSLCSTPTSSPIARRRPASSFALPPPAASLLR